MKSVTVRAVLILVACASFLVLFAPVLARLVQDWANDGNYSHGFLILPLALYFVWERRKRLAVIPPQPTLLGLGVVAAGLAMLLAGVLGAELFLTRLSIIVVAAGAILFLFGWATCRVLVFPLSFLLLMIPIPALVFNQIAFPLQLLASRFGEAVMSAADVPVLREGNVLILANTTLEVAEACSGIRSLVSLLTLAIVLGYFSDKRSWVRCVVALSSIPVAVITNGIRVAGTGIAAHRFGAAAAEGFIHEFSGWLVFVAAFGLTIVVQRIIVAVAPKVRPTAPLPSSV
jgi:exosortase